MSFLDVDWGTESKGWALELEYNVMGEPIYLNARLFSGSKCKLKARAELHGILGLIFGRYLCWGQRQLARNEDFASVHR